MAKIENETRSDDPNNNSTAKNNSKNDSKHTDSNPSRTERCIHTTTVNIEQKLYNNFDNNLDNSNLIFNYSKINLTNAMRSILNKGINFAILPKKLDLTQIMVDYKRFQRSMIWIEYWFGKDKLEAKPSSIFKIKKNNLPKFHKNPHGLNVTWKQLSLKFLILKIGIK